MYIFLASAAISGAFGFEGISLEMLGLSIRKSDEKLKLRGAPTPNKKCWISPKWKKKALKLSINASEKDRMTRVCRI
jgi:hypothetical protein